MRPLVHSDVRDRATETLRLGAATQSHEARCARWESVYGCTQSNRRGKENERNGGGVAVRWEWQSQRAQQPHSLTPSGRIRWMLKTASRNGCWSARGQHLGSPAHPTAGAGAHAALGTQLSCERTFPIGCGPLGGSLTSKESSRSQWLMASLPLLFVAFAGIPPDCGGDAEESHAEPLSPVSDAPISLQLASAGFAWWRRAARMSSSCRPCGQ
jgi:hypothetical protein